MKKNLIVAVGIFLSGSICHPAIGQESYTQRLNGKLQDLIGFLSPDEDRSKSNGLREIHSFFDIDSLQIDESAIHISEWNQRKKRSDFGISLTGSADQYFGQGFDSELGPFNRHKISLGIEWNLLAGGWRSNRIQSDIYKNETNILRLEQYQEAMQKAYGAQYNTIIYLFNKEKIGLLKKYKNHLEEILPIYQNLYLSHIVSFTRLLDIKKKIEKASLMIFNFTDFNQSFERTYGSHWAPLSSNNFPALQFSISELLQAEDSGTFYHAVRDIENENIRLKNCNKSAINISLYARKNYTSGQSQGLNNSYESAGIRMSVPISSLYSSNKKGYRLEVEEHNQRSDWMNQERIKEIMVEYYEYENHLQKYAQLHFESHKLKENIRQKQVLIRLDSSRSSAAKALVMAEEKIEVAYEMIGTRQLLYLGLLKIQRRLTSSDIMSFCTAYQYANDYKLKGRRYYKIDSLDLINLDEGFVINYLINNECEAVVSNDLSSTFLKKLNFYDIQWLRNAPANSLTVQSKKFNSRIAIEDYINSNSLIDQPIMLSGFGELIEIEKRIIKALTP